MQIRINSSLTVEDRIYFRSEMILVFSSAEYRDLSGIQFLSKLLEYVFLFASRDAVLYIRQKKKMRFGILIKSNVK